MEKLDSRRLTGLNLLWDFPGAIVDGLCTPDEADLFIPIWEREVRRILDAVGWAIERTCCRRYDYGISVAISAPIDALYAACEVLEWSWDASMAQLGQADTGDFESEASRLRQVVAEEANPQLIVLRDAAKDRGVAFLSDDDVASVGLGVGSKAWPVSEIPSAREVPWSEVRDIPVGLVTGTNGKTTTARLAGSIVAAAGRTAGITCTDWIGVGENLIDRGDYSGPGGARTALRHQDVDVAILETARGGLLRRGLGVQRADAAVITTIAEDHLGDFGSRTIEELLDIKWVVTRALSRDGILVLNADDRRLVAKSEDVEATLAWFSLDPNNEVVKRHVAGGGLAAIVREGELVLFDSGEEHSLCLAADIPVTLGGAARHNIANALAAAALTFALGLPRSAIADGLLQTKINDNPGRCNLFKVDGVRVVVDYAHNPQGMQAMFDLALALPAKRRLLSLGQAGDRPDELIVSMARAAGAIGLDRAHIVDIPHHSRGRPLGEVPVLLETGLVEGGTSRDAVHHYGSEIDSLRAALEWGESGDLVLIMALSQRESVLELLESANSD